MEAAIEKRDIDSLKELIKIEKKSGTEDDLIHGKVDQLIRKRGLKVALQPTSTIEEFGRRHFHFVLNVMKQGLCSKMMPITTLQDILESSSIEQCKLLFTIVEEHMIDFKQPPLNEIVQNSILRCCNDLLRRLSRTAETSFCGRIMFFLSRYLPLAEKSGLNLMGHFNTQNITTFDEEHTNQSPMDEDEKENEDMETGEIDDSKEVNITPEMYCQFWSLQKFMSNPTIIFEKEKFVEFKNGLSMVFSLFQSNKLDKSSLEDEEYEAKNKKTIDESNDHFFSKFLTSPKLLSLQLNDSQLRRHFLLQCLFIFQYLVSDVKFKSSTKKLILNEEQLKFINSSEEKCYKLLSETMPKGSSFSSICKKILQKELEWSAWKNANCPDLSEKADKAPMQMYRKRNRLEFEPDNLDLGTPELTKIWNNDTSILESCKRSDREFVPKLVDFIRDPLDEMDPEQQVEEIYKSVNNITFQWRCSRLLLTKSPQYLAKLEKTSEPTSNMKECLEKAIYNTARNLDEFKADIAARDQKEADARKRVEESLKRKLGTENNGTVTCSPNPYNDIILEDENLEVLAEALSGFAKRLASVLGVPSNEIERRHEMKDYKFCLMILRNWTKEHGRTGKVLLHKLIGDVDIVEIATKTMKEFS